LRATRDTFFSDQQQVEDADQVQVEVLGQGGHERAGPYIDIDMSNIRHIHVV
jgi:hypothetical protein